MADSDLSLTEILADIQQTPRVRRAVARKGQLFVEGALPLDELRRGRVHKAFVSALNRLRKKAKLSRLPYDEFVVEWYAEREQFLEYRIYAVGCPHRYCGAKDGGAVIATCEKAASCNAKMRPPDKVVGM